MALEPIGILTLLVGLSCFVFGQQLSIFALLIASLLGASAAAFITAMNNANIQPAHFLLVFLAADLCLRGPVLKAGLESLAIPRAGFWLLLTLIYGILAAIFMPRLFAGTTYVFNIAQLGSGGAGIVQVPLGPVSANVTQSIYFAADFICFIIFYAYSSNREGLQTIAQAMIVCAFVNLGFALLDLITYLTGTAEFLSLFRNTSYRMLDDIELAGFKRLVGSFTEASAFAYATLGLFAFTFTLWLRGAYSPVSGIAAALSLVALVFSTSTAGYFGLTFFVLFQYAHSLLQLLARRATRNVLVFLVFAPIVASVLAISIWMHPAPRHAIQQVIEVTVFSKFDSESGIERASWNAQAVNAFRDTMGLGAGIGSVRASSWLIAVPASIGVLGALTYGIFVVCVLLGGGLRKRDPKTGAIQSAARASCLAQIMASSVAGSFIDLGLVFFALAGAACAIPQTNMQPAGMRRASRSMVPREVG
jgi:hypothetical protein